VCAPLQGVPSTVQERDSPSKDDAVLQVKKAERNQDAINQAFRPRLSSAPSLGPPSLPATMTIDLVLAPACRCRAFSPASSRSAHACWQVCDALYSRCRQRAIQAWRQLV